MYFSDVHARSMLGGGFPPRLGGVNIYGKIKGCGGPAEAQTSGVILPRQNVKSIPPPSPSQEEQKKERIEKGGNVSSLLFPFSLLFP